MITLLESEPFDLQFTTSLYFKRLSFELLFLCKCFV